MDFDISKAIDDLYKNAAVFYNEQYSLINEQINTLIVDLNAHIQSRLDNKFAIYNTLFYIKESQRICSYCFDNNIANANQQIQRTIQECLHSSTSTALKASLQKLISDLRKYQQIIATFFKNRYDLLAKYSSANDYIEHINKDIFLVNNRPNTHFFYKITELYKETLEAPTDALIEKYRSYFKQIKHSLTNNQLPIVNNHLLGILEIAYHKTYSLHDSTICNGDYILINALANPVENTKLDILEKIEKNYSSYLKLQPLNSFSKDKKELYNNIEYGIFSTENMFSDFDIHNIFFTKRKKSDGSLLINLADYSKLIDKLPESIIDLEKIYNSTSQTQAFWGFFCSEKSNTILNKLIESSPAKLLQDIANKYFHLILQIATTLNAKLTQKDDLSIFSNFEMLFKDICLEVKRGKYANKTLIEQLGKKICLYLPKIEEQYLQLLATEKVINQNMRESPNIVVAPIFQHISHRDKLNYRNIISQTNTIDISFSKSIDSINKNIDKLKLNEAAIQAKEVAIKLLEASYYNTPKLVSIRELPPFSNETHQILTSLENKTPSICTLINLQDSYWSAS